MTPQQILSRGQIYTIAEKISQKQGKSYVSSGPTKTNKTYPYECHSESIRPPALL
jgi:hypothetical protein